MTQRKTASILNYLKKLPTWKPSTNLYFRRYTCKIELGPFNGYEDAVRVDKPNRSKIQYIFNDKTEEYEVYNTVYTDDIDLLHALESSYDYKNIYSPLSEEHEKLLKTSKDNKVIIRDKLWYNKFRYKIEVYRNWRDRNYVEKTLEEAHEFILKTFDPSTSKTRRWSHYNSYSIPNVYTNDINSIMLLKLAYNDTLRIQVVEVTKINELK